MWWLLAGCAAPEPGAASPVEPYAPVPMDRAVYASCEATSELDVGEDGVDRVDVTVYDALGWPIALNQRALEQGSVRGETWSGRNAWGLFARHEIDDDGDGRADLIEEGDFAAHLWTWFRVDEHADLWVDVRIEHTNANGLRVASTIDEGGEGNGDVAVSYAYDSANRPLLEAYDRGMDGEDDAWWTWTYADGVTTRTHEDRFGTLETWRETYDISGHLLESAYAAASTQREETHTWEGDNRVRVDVTTWEDGDLVATATTTWGHDAKGREISAVDTTRYGDFEVIQRTTTAWSCPPTPLQ